MQIKKVEITWEDNSTTVVVPETKLAPETQGTGLADLEPAHDTSTSITYQSNEATGAAPIETATSTATNPTVETVEPLAEKSE